MHRTKGEKASQKRMATVGTVYTVDRYVRTPEQVVAALFRDEPERSKDRPRPQHKQVWASLLQDDDSLSGQAAVFTWLNWELRLPQSGPRKGDGLPVRWPGDALASGGRGVAGSQRRGGSRPVACDAALRKTDHVFHSEKSQEAETFVRERLLRVLQGKAAGVIRGLREMATKHGLTGCKKKAIREICGYLKNNLARMRYDEYLAAGYPIASGAIEGGMPALGEGPYGASGHAFDGHRGAEVTVHCAKHICEWSVGRISELPDRNGKRKGFIRTVKRLHRSLTRPHSGRLVTPD